MAAVRRDGIHWRTQAADGQQRRRGPVAAATAPAQRPRGVAKGARFARHWRRRGQRRGGPRADAVRRAAQPPIPAADGPAVGGAHRQARQQHRRR